MTKLLTPRWISIASLVGGGAALGDGIWRLVHRGNLPFETFTYAASLATPLCMAIAVAAWAMRDKADDTFDPDYLASAEYARSRLVVKDLRVRSMVLAMVAIVCAGLAGGPALAAQHFKAVWEWMAIASGVAVGLSGVCFQVAFWWEEQLRAHRETLIAASKDRDERAAMIERIQRVQPITKNWGAGWGEPVDELQLPH